MPPIIEVRDLTKRYKGAETNAVDGVSFDVAPGELFALLGPNGAGKTTTISILTTTLAPTGGTVRIAGHDLATEAAAVRREVGIIFQKPSLDLNLSAEENVRFHAVLYGLYPFRPSFRLMPAAYRAQIRELAALLGIEKELGKPVKTFSGGMRRKLEILRSLLHRPRVLFLDEPTVGLDPTSRRALWDELTETRKEHGVTVFLTTHYLDEAEQADTICIVKGGRVVAQGSPDKLKAELLQASLVVDAADRDRLRAELSRIGLPFTETPRFQVALNGEGAHALLKRIETPLTVVQTHAPSLEDAYLAIVADGAGATEASA
ncbi:MAG: Efflux ABC transporter, ATP-binding protein [uncultured Thermomicrobiales bacterium]|uniref:Efflux ABC transporter, ATP-binding protein n=1 Tax=uncultured Thermomicrobiales bacterium TaxID=1645740 RepID=A0A6J4U7L0_9BACT|nr:MAG: Efflux ABC transporter, ATP-binding protein [uncultured Thermomicrobiales bacterium]